jgi:cell division septal protein FtsQ
MSGRPVARRSRAPIPTRTSRGTVRRRSAGLSATRAGAALAMLLSALAIYGVGASSAFTYAHLQVDGASLTDTTRVEAAIAGARGHNLFGLRTGPLKAALDALPTVKQATVDVRLPGTLAVTLHERQPVLVWQVGARRYLADGDGALFVLLSDQPPASAAGLPVIDDRRAASAGLSVGQRLDPVDLDAATRLASLRPVDVGSTARTLGVLVTDENGFVLQARPDGWSAVFGFYTPTLRTTALVPGQVRLLRSLLSGREASVDRVVLASATDGTYLPRATPTPSATPKKSSAKPSRAP